MAGATMRALWLEDGRVRMRDDVPVPDPPPGEALVRVRRAGVCATDLELVRDYYPYRGVLGHEFVGIVEDVAPPEDVGRAGRRRQRRAEGEPAAGTAPARPDDLVGRRVVGEINAVCGACRPCRAGRPTHCADRTVLGIVGRDGAFAEYLTLPVANLHPVPDGVCDEVATFTEPLAAALEIQEQVTVGPDDRVVVVGDGRLGQLVARSLALTGCELTVVGRHRRKLELLASAGVRAVLAGRPGGGAGPAAAEPPADRDDGADGAVQRDDGAAQGSEELPEGLAPRAHDLAVDCTGHPSGFETARRALRPRGTLVMKSTYAGRLSLDASALVVDEITVVGSRCGPFRPALRHLARGRIDPSPLVDDRFPLAEAEGAIERAAEPGVLKVLLEM